MIAAIGFFKRQPTIKKFTYKSDNFILIKT